MEDKMGNKTNTESLVELVHLETSKMPKNLRNSIYTKEIAKSYDDDYGPGYIDDD